MQDLANIMKRKINESNTNRQLAGNWRNEEDTHLKQNTRQNNEAETDE